MILSGCVLTAVKTEIQNVAYEIGIPADKAGTIPTYDFIGEIIFRLIWSFTIKWISIPNCMLVVCGSYLTSQIIFGKG